MPRSVPRPRANHGFVAGNSVAIVTSGAILRGRLPVARASKLLCQRE
jgi:hypothetical protein